MRKSLFRLAFARLLRVTESPNPCLLDFLQCASDRNYQVSKTVASAKLPEHKYLKLIPAREMLYVAVFLVLGNKPVALAAVQIRG